MTTAATLTIDRLRCHVRLAGGATNPGEVGDALARAAAGHLPAVLAELALPDGDAVVRLRALRLNLVAAPGSEPDEAVAARWGQALGAALGRVLRDDDPARVVRFDSPQAYTLAFLRDLSDGRAWGRWYFDEFAPLRILPDAAAALELLIARPAWAVALLRDLLRSGHGARLLARWSAVDLARLWAALGIRPATPTATALEAAAPLWPGAALGGGADADARARDALRLWLAAPVPDAAALAAARLLVDVAAAVRLAPEARGVLLMRSEFYPHLIARMEAHGVLAALGSLPESDDGRALLARAAEVVTPTLAAPAPATTGDAALSSPVGAVWLLLAPLARLEVWPRWLAGDGETAARRYLFVVALKALGRHAAGHVDDRLVAAFAGLSEPPPADPGPGFAWLLPALDDALAATAAEALRRFAALLPAGFEESSAAYLAANFLAHPAELRRERDAWRVRLDGGPLRMVLRMAALPERVSAPWLPVPVVFEM